MRAIAAAAALALLVGAPGPAAAWDPLADDIPAEPVGPAPIPVPVPSPLRAEVPSGIYRVTDVYVGAVVTRSGPLTTYTTITARQDHGTYARVLETVATGAASAYDGTAFNGRATLSDGRPIAGTYYENFVLTQGHFVPVSVVFFQDDRELAAQPPAPSTTPGARPVGPAPDPAAIPVPTSAPRLPVIAAGVATSPLGDLTGTLVVLRGRPVDLWARATIDGRAASVKTWRIVAGEHVALGASSGVGGEPFRARWDDATTPGTAWTTQVEATLSVGGVAYTARGDVRVSVRSPALIR